MYNNSWFKIKQKEKKLHCLMKYFSIVFNLFMCDNKVSHKQIWYYYLNY